MPSGKKLPPISPQCNPFSPRCSPLTPSIFPDAPRNASCGPAGTCATHRAVRTPVPSERGRTLVRMNTRRHLSLVPSVTRNPASQGCSAALPRLRRASGLPSGGHAAGFAALAAGLTLGLMAGGASTLLTHPGDAAAVLVPLAGASGLTMLAAFRSRAVAQRRRRRALQRREQATTPRPTLVHSRDDFRPVVIAPEPVAQPIGRAA